MWDKFRALLPEFPSAVLSALDTDGQPFSVRCQPQPDEAANCFTLSPQPIELQAGPASLLFHKQGPHIDKLKSFLLRGTLGLDASAWTFTPTAFVPGIGIGGLLGQLRFLREGQRGARRYFAQRGQPYPRLDWDALERAGKEVQQED